MLGPATAGAQGPSAAEIAPLPATILVESLKDFVAFPSVRTVSILEIGAVLAVVVHPADRNINWQVRGSDYRFLTTGNIVGKAGIQMGAAVGTYLIGYQTGGRESRVAVVGAELVRAQILAQGLTFALKAAVRRERPDGSDHGSFPSGHAATTFAAATVLGSHLGWRVAIPSYLVAAYVASDRLHENRHRASDVIFGAALGVAVGETVRSRGSSAVEVRPLVLSEGVGVSFVW